MYSLGRHLDALGGALPRHGTRVGAARTIQKPRPEGGGLSNKGSWQAVVSVRPFCGGQPRAKYREMFLVSRVSDRRFGKDESQ
jgi:hypothetical protein